VIYSKIEFLMLRQGNVFAQRIHIWMSHLMYAQLNRLFVTLNAGLVPVPLKMSVPAAIFTQTLEY
jgi:hypothetical protein